MPFVAHIAAAKAGDCCLSRRRVSCSLVSAYLPHRLVYGQYIRRSLALGADTGGEYLHVYFEILPAIDEGLHCRQVSFISDARTASCFEEAARATSIPSLRPALNRLARP